MSKTNDNNVRRKCDSCTLRFYILSNNISKCPRCLNENTRLIAKGNKNKDKIKVIFNIGDSISSIRIYEPNTDREIIEDDFNHWKFGVLDKLQDICKWSICEY